MNERDPLAPPCDTSWGLVALLWGAGIGAAMQFAKFSVAFDDLTKLYATNPSLIGLALSSVGFVGLVCGGSAGVLAERIGYRRLLIWAAGFGALLSFGQSFLPPIEVLLLMRFLEGISHIAIVVAAPILMVRVAARRHRFFVMTLWGSFFGVAFTIVGGLAPLGLKAYGVSGLFQAHALIMIVMAVLARGALGSQREGNNDRAYSFQRFIDDSVSVYVNPRTILPGFIFAFYASMFLALLTFMPRLVEDSAISALLFTILPITSTVTTFLVGFVPGSRVAPPVLTLVAYIFVAVLTLLAAGVTGSAQSFAVVTVFLFAASGLIQGATYATIPYLNQALPDQVRANGALAQLGNLGATLGTPMFAAVISSNGVFGVAALVFFLCVAGAMSAFLAFRLNAKRRLTP